LKEGKVKDTILIVDDIEVNRVILEEILKEEYDTASAEDGKKAVSLVLSGEVKPSIVLLDIMMPEMDGYAVLETLKNNPSTKNIPVIFISAANAETNEGKGLEMGAVDDISKPVNVDIVKARVKTHLGLYHYSSSLEAKLVNSKARMLETMANFIEYRNFESGSHVKRTRELTRILANCLSINAELGCHVAEEDVNIMALAAPLHDVGKISIPDKVLLKPGKLTEEEFDTMKTHTTIGGEIITKMIDDDESSDEENRKYLQYCREIATYHHERWDGTGYPNGISGEDIPIAARILSLVDVYDALVSERVYKKAMTHEKAAEIISESAGTQFDAKVVDAFNLVEEKFKEFMIESS
jgi:putative two-component system response regulator